MGFKTSEERRVWFRTRYKERVELGRSILGGKCVKCNRPDKLEFDHIDPKTKHFKVGDSAGVNRKLSVFLEEVAKCQLLCFDCHVEKTKINKEHGKGGQNKILGDRCGMCAGYIVDGCRCIRCKEWHRLYKNKEVDARGNRLT
jgi:hypothetical protein